MARRAWSEHDAARVIALCRLALETGEPQSTTVASRSGSRSDVATFTLELHRIALADDSHGIVCYLRDISDERRRNDFLTMLAHELRNPLALIRNAVQLLRLKTPPVPMLTGAEDLIDRQVSQLARMVEDLEDVGRVAGGEMTLRREPLDLNLVVQNAVETCRPVVEGHRHRLTVRLPAENTTVAGDFARLTQVVANLLHNAARYTEDGGQIRLTVGRTGDPVTPRATIHVSDTGRGIEPDRVERVFDLFYQADGGLERPEGGLGVGLTLARRIAELHGGTLEAASEGAGRGSTFTLALPMITAPPATARPAPPAVRSRRILIADDNADVAESLRMLLELDGHRVRIAGDGEAGARGQPRVPSRGRADRHRHAEAERLRRGPPAQGFRLGPEHPPDRAHRLGTAG